MSSIDHVSELESLRLQVADLTRALVERDHSLRTQSQEGLHRQRRHLMDAQAIAHLGSWDWDIDSGEVWWSEELFRIFGHKPGAITVTYDIFLASLHPDDHDSVVAAINDALLGKRAYDMEYRIVRPNGEVRSIHARGEVRADSTGRPLSMAGTALDVTERKRTEKALRLSEQRHASLLNTIDGIVWEADAITFCFTFVSSQAERILGYPIQQWLHDPSFWPDRIHSEDRSRAMTYCMEQTKSGQAHDFEYRMVAADGRVVWLRDLVTVFLDEGQPARLRGIMVDITERKRAEEALRVSEERFALAVAGSTDILWDGHPLPGEPWYASQTPLWWSPSVRQLLGLEESESFDTLDQWAGRLHSDDKDSVFRQLTAHIEHRVPYDAEYRLRTNGGDYRWVRARGQASWDEHGKPLRMSGSCQDITDHKRAEEALRKSEERYARATAAGKVGVWELDVVTGNYHGDPNLKMLFGYASNELSTDPSDWLNLVYPDDRPMTLDYWQRVVNGETDNYNHELRMIKKDGTVIWTDVRGHAVRNDEGQLTHLFGATVDISGRKEVQDALIQSEHQLRIVLDALPVGVWFTDRSGKPLLSNPAAKQIWSNIRQIGLQTLDNPSGWWETIGAANEPHRWALSNTLATGAPSLNETFDFECLDGTKKTIRNSTVPVQDEKGVVVGAIIVNEDITALRQAQEALKLTQFSVDQAVEGFLWISPDARILHVNDAACRMLEYSHDELTGMTLPDIDPNFLLEAWSVHWDECKQKGSLTFETKHWSRTGRILDMEVTFNYLRYEEKEYNCAIMRDIGERKRADAALRASEERFRELYDDTPTMYFTLAMDGTVRSVNRFGAEQLGYQVEELIGSSVLGVFHKDDKETVAANLSECLSTPGTTRHWEFRKVRKDGSIIWVWETARVGQSSTGETVVLVTCEDITARKQAEQAVTLFRVLLDQADDSIEIIDPATGRFLDSNEMAFSSLGYTSQEHRLLTVPDIDPIVTAPLFAQSIARIREYGSVTLETVHRRKDGSTFPVEVKARLVQLDREYLLAIVRDITDRKKAEEALQASEARLRLVLDTLPAAAFTCDTDGSITYFNKRAFDLWGCSPELNHFENRSCSSLKFYLPDGTPVPHDQCYWMVMEVKEGRTVHGNEIVIERPDGHRRSVLAHANMLRDQDGHIAGTVNVLIDITEQKRMEEALRQRERDLRAAIEERERISQDLHDGILQSLFAVGLTLETAKSIMPLRTRKMSGPPLDQAIDQLNRVMHEIRNFIAGLGLDLFRGGDLPTALEHMLASLTKNQATRVRLAVEDRAARAISAEQALHLLLVIQEAVTNCIRHGRAQEATVSFKMLKRGVRLSIHDNGHGFNPEVATGTGHGLRNMAARAKKIGGRFTITSKVDEGTRIILDLPKEASDVLR